MLVQRRTLFKAAGLGALVTSGGLVAPSPAAGSPGRPDVIVIGAGFAGITAARELSAQGLRPLIIEARDRIGGRVHPGTIGGRRIQFGAQWICERQTLVAAELARYGIGTVVDPIAETSVMPAAGGGFAAVDPGVVYARQADLFGQLFAGSERYLPSPADPLFRADLIRRIDRLSLRDRLDQLALSPLDKSWINGTTASYSGGSSSRGALTALAQWWQLGGGTIDGWYGLLAYSPETGLDGLLRAMLADVTGDLRLGTAAQSVVDTGSGVRVTTTRGTVTAPAVVVAVPVNVWRTLLFSPSLPAVHATASAQGVGVPDSIKFWVRCRHGRGRIAAQAQEGFGVSSMFTYAELGGGEQLIVGFSEDQALDFNDRAGVRAILDQFVPGIEVLDVRAHSWGVDPYARGAWALRRPGQLLTQLPAIQRPHGRIAFASGDAATAWNGFVDGAIESGVRAARQVLALRR